MTKKGWKRNEKDYFDSDMWHSVTSDICVNAKDSEYDAEEIQLLDEFINMYENTLLNNEIIDKVRELKDKNKSISEKVSTLKELSIMVPYNTGVCEALQRLASVFDFKENNIKIDGRKYDKNNMFDVGRGISYATSYYAKGSNPKHELDAANCTNFVSHIKKYGGVEEYYSYVWVKQEQVLVKQKSWYFDSKSNVGGLWAAADRFVMFFGVKSSTKNFRTFSQDVKRGSFITYDSEGDGKWNHMG